MRKIFILLFSSILLLNCSSKINYSSNKISNPEIFGPGIISKVEESVFDIAFSPNGKSAYFTTRKGNGKQKIMQSDYENFKWSEPKICEFSNNRDETPFLTSNGKTMYFGSQRDIPNNINKGNFDMNIWKTTKNANSWSNPKPINELNQVQEVNEEWPSSNANFIFSNNDKNFIYCTMKRGTKTIEIYKVKLQNGFFRETGKINNLFDDEKYWKYSAIISPDEQYLIFNSSNVPIGAGGEDIFVSKKTKNGWSKAKSIGNLINTKAEESSPRFSRDGKYFFFGRENRINPNEDGIWSIYYIETKYLELYKLFNN